MTDQESAVREWLDGCAKMITEALVNGGSIEPDQRVRFYMTKGLCVSKDPRHFCGYAGPCVYEEKP